MSGYRWDPVFRVVPQNGGETVYWLKDRLSDTLGYGPTRITVRYVESQKMREDITRALRPVIFGIRPEVDIECTVLTMADQAFIAEITNALLRPRDYTVYLSLDGRLVEREVVLAAVPQLTPLAGRTIVGSLLRLSVRCKDLIETMPAMMTDPGVGREMLQDGGFEQWSGAGDLQAFQENATGGTISQEAVKIHTAGGSALKFDYSGAGNLLIQQANMAGIIPGMWYTLSGWFATDNAGSHGRCGFQNQTNTLMAKGDGTGWGAATQYALDLLLSDTSYHSSTLTFRIDPSYLATDLYKFYAFAYQTGVVSYVDDCSLLGPVLRSGYATW